MRLWEGQRRGPEIPGDASACWSLSSKGLENIPDEILIPKDNYMQKNLYGPQLTIEMAFLLGLYVIKLYVKFIIMIWTK